MSPSPTGEVETARATAHADMQYGGRCKGVQDHSWACNRLTQAIETREAALRARIAELEGALRPFAGCSRMRSGDVADTWDCGECPGCNASRALGTPKGEAKP